MPIVIARNNTGSVVNVDDIGIEFASSEVKDLTHLYDFIDLVESEDLRTFVADGTISISDGTSYLNIANGLYHLSIDSIHTDYIQDEDLVNIPTVLPAAGAVRTTQYTIPQVNYADVVYLTEEYHSDRDTLEWLVSEPTRITIKVDGLYHIVSNHYVRVGTNYIHSTFARILKNGTTVVSPEVEVRTYVNETQQMSVSCIVPLVAGDYITSQVRCDSGSNIDSMDSDFIVFKMEGVEGPAGPPGGTTVETQNSGTTITTNTSVLNFQGNGVTVTSGPSTTSNITINSNTFQPKYVQVYDATGNINVNSTTPQVIQFTNQDIRDTDTFTWSSTTNRTRVIINTSGWYEVSYSINYNDGSARRNVVSYLRQNGTSQIPRTLSSSYVRTSADEYGHNMVGGVLIQFNAGDYVELFGYGEGSTGSVTTIPNECWLSMKLIREV